MKNNIRKNPLVSVIVPAFNSDKYISETINSIINQEYINIEIYVVDDGSTDDTAQILSKYEKKIKYIYQKNSGPSITRNTGIKESTGEIICFIDSDDIMTSDRIKIQVEFLMRHPHVGIVFCDYQNFNENGEFFQTHFQMCPIVSKKLNNKVEIIINDGCHILTQENFGITSSILLRKEILKFEKGFEPTLTGGEDFHFYYRLARHTPVGLINKVGIKRRLHNSNISGDVEKMRIQAIRSRSILLQDEKDPKNRHFLRCFILKCKGDLARFHADRGFFSQSLKYDLEILGGRPFWCPEKMGAFRNILRTILLAAGWPFHQQK